MTEEVTEVCFLGWMKMEKLLNLKSWFGYRESSRSHVWAVDFVEQKWSSRVEWGSMLLCVVKFNREARGGNVDVWLWLMSVSEDEIMDSLSCNEWLWLVLYFSVSLIFSAIYVYVDGWIWTLSPKWTRLWAFHLHQWTIKFTQILHFWKKIFIFQSTKPSKENIKVEFCGQQETPTHTQKRQKYIVRGHEWINEVYGHSFIWVHLLYFNTCSLFRSNLVIVRLFSAQRNYVYAINNLYIYVS